MKRYLRFFIVIGFLFLCVFLGFKFGLDRYYTNQINSINEGRITFLDNYNTNKALAESYLQVYEIVDEDSYQQIKNDMYHNFSSDMQEQIFPTVNYEGLDLHTITSEIIRVVGTNNGPDGKNVFLLEYNLKGINYDQNITNLIEIADGVITSVVRIK